MRENITLNQEEQKRLYVLNQVIEGKLIASKAARLLKRSVRQLRRWIAEYRQGSCRSNPRQSGTATGKSSGQRNGATRGEISEGTLLRI
jgi:hypothetical protein